MKRFKTPEELDHCHLLFVSSSVKDRLEAILTGIRGRPVATVSDMPAFARKGGVFGFFLEGKKVRFEINVARAQKEGLKISAKLLRLAKLVDEAEPPENK